MSCKTNDRKSKMKFISDTMIGFYSVMRNLQEDYATYHQNYSEEALALLSKSYDFIESVEAVRSLDSLSSIDDDSMDREMTFEEIGDYKVSAKVYKVMKQSLFSSLKELVQDYEFKVVVDESDNLYATMDFFDKLLKALQNVSWKEVAATSAEEVLKTLPMIVGTIIAVSAVLIALSMTPIGLLVSMLTPVVGAVMQAYAGANVIKDIAAGLYLFTDAVIQTKEAKSKGAMEQTSALFTKAFEYVGPNLLMDILMFFGGKAMKNVKGANKIEPVKEKQIFGKLNDNIEKSLNIELKIDKDDLTTVRTRLGVPKTETVAVGKTNVKGLEKITFEGQSPKVRKEAGLPDLDEVWRNRNIKAPGQNPLFTRHAEEVLANSFDKAVIEATEPKISKSSHRSYIRGFTKCKGKWKK